MAQIHARLNDVEAWGGESGGALPPGTYNFLIKDVKQEQSSKGKPQLKLELVVTSEGEYKDRQTMSWYTLNFEKDAPRKRLKALVLATGIQLDQNGDFDDAQLKGAVFTGDVQVEPYTATDPASQQQIRKERSRIINERPVGQGAAAGAPAAGMQPGMQPQQGFAPNAQPGMQPNAPAGGYPAPQGQPVANQPQAGAPQATRGNPLTPVG